MCAFSSQHIMNILPLYKIKAECFNQSFVNRSLLSMNGNYASLLPKANKTKYSLSTIILTESLVITVT